MSVRKDVERRPGGSIPRILRIVRPEDQGRASKRDEPVVSFSSPPAADSDGPCFSLVALCVPLLGPPSASSPSSSLL